MFKKIFLAVCLLFSSCGKSPASPAQFPKPLVLVSIAPYQFFAEKIAGSAIEVHTIVPQGTSAHTFEPTSRQIDQISRARVWLRVGEPFEAKILPLLQERNKQLSVLDLRDGIDLLSSAGDLSCEHCSMEHQDRHIWMSPRSAMLQAEAMGKFLTVVFPEHKEAFESRLQTLLQELALLDLEIHAMLAPVKERVILVSHPAFGYFCRDYNCEQLSVEYEGKDPRPQHLEEILRQALTKKAGMAIALPQYNNKGAQLIAKKLHLPVQMIDPYSPDYFETMRKLALLISDPETHGI